jgi:CheY-like chemotaxis protein
MIGKILLAEDNILNVRLALYGLKEYEVDVAVNGQEAIDLFSANKYDLVIVDIHMPVVDGIEAARKIRMIESAKEIKTGVVILGMTADWLPDIIEECKNAGLNGFLPKPFRPKELSELIKGLYLKCVNDISVVSLPEE